MTDKIGSKRETAGRRYISPADRIGLHNFFFFKRKRMDTVFLSLFYPLVTARLRSLISPVCDTPRLHVVSFRPPEITSPPELSFIFRIVWRLALLQISLIHKDKKELGRTLIRTTSFCRGPQYTETASSFHFNRKEEPVLFLKKKTSARAIY